MNKELARFGQRDLGYPGSLVTVRYIHTATLNSGVNYLASYDTDTKQLWVTFLSDLSSGQSWEIVLN